jgi:hypothetical protein
MGFPPIGRISPRVSPSGTLAARMSKLDSYRTRLVKDKKSFCRPDAEWNIRKGGSRVGNMKHQDSAPTALSGYGAA